MSRAEAAAAFLREARLAGRREPAIPEACAPRDEAEAKAVWQALYAMEDRNVIGWEDRRDGHGCAAGDGPFRAVRRAYLRGHGR